MGVAGADLYSPRIGQVRLTRVRIHQPKRPYLYLVTNDRTCTPSQAWACKISRWPIEPMFRDEKQLLDLAGCQSPRVEAQATHIALVLVAWVVLQCLRQAPSQTAGEVQAALVATIWGHETRLSACVSDSVREPSLIQGVQRYCWGTPPERPFLESPVPLRREPRNFAEIGRNDLVGWLRTQATRFRDKRQPEKWSVAPV